MSEKNLQLILKAIDQVEKPFTSKQIEAVIGEMRNATSMLNYLLKRNILKLVAKHGRVNVYDLRQVGISAVRAHREWRLDSTRLACQSESEVNYEAVPFLLASVKLTADNPRIRL